MTNTPDWELDRYRPLLRLQIRQMDFNPQLRQRFGSSDLIQETMTKAVRNKTQFRGTTEAELVKWLQVILRNVVKDKIVEARAGKRDPAMEQSLQRLEESSVRIDEFLAADQTSPSEHVERKEQLLRLAKAIELLPEDQREVVIQKDLLGRTLAEISETLGKTEKSIAGLLLRGRQSLRKLLHQNE